MVFKQKKIYKLRKYYVQFQWWFIKILKKILIWYGKSLKRKTILDDENMIDGDENVDEGKCNYFFLN